MQKSLPRYLKYIVMEYTKSDSNTLTLKCKLFDVVDGFEGLMAHVSKT